MPRGLVWNTNMAAVSLFWNTNMAAVTSCENALYALSHTENNWRVAGRLPWPEMTSLVPFSRMLGLALNNANFKNL